MCPPVTLPLQAELRIYQLELANREKNYNKLFGVNPVVGVLDPVTFTVSHMQLVCWDVFFYVALPFFRRRKLEKISVTPVLHP